MRKPLLLASALAMGGVAGPARAGDAPAEVTLTRGAAVQGTVGERAPAALEGALEIFRRARSGDFVASFQNERLENLVRSAQLEDIQAEGRFQDLFIDGDEAFEFEPDGTLGASMAAAPVHDGERGGADGSSCRGCHFVGGPDGAGSSTQRALFRGDGARVSSAIVRDAPHVMGLGYVSRIAREMEAELLVLLTEAEDIAATTTLPVHVPLVAKGIDFGELVALPGGSVDRSLVEGISPDLRVRPFGRKGRHTDLVAVVDEALAVHHGLQSASRLREHAGETDVIGDGPEEDPDGDGVVATALTREGQPGAETSPAQAVLLAGYLSLLGVPEIHPPRRADLLVAWTRGRELLDEVGCTACHVEKLVMNEDLVELQARAGYATSLSFTLEDNGQEPRALRTDDGPGAGPGGRIPIFAYTDLKRHDLGPDIAERVAEELPDGAGAIPGSVWLTRSLWGLADTAPYMPDGRATTLDEAIALHGGEAASARDAYSALDEEEQAALRMFLLSLTRNATVLVE